MTRKTYCGNLLWQSGLTLLALNGRYGLIEVKIGGAALIAEGRRKLHALADEIDTKRMPAPSFMMIVVAEGDYAYEDTDGTLICPIGCLRP